jgi:hypothetical protein
LSARTARSLAAALATAWLAAHASAAERRDTELSVRVVQVRGAGTCAEGKSPELEESLEPLREHLKQLPHAKFALLDKATKKCALDKATSFDLQNKHHADATVATDKDRSGRLLVTLHVTKTAGDKTEDVLTTVHSIKDGATFLEQISKAADDKDDLILAVTASREPL